MNRNSLVEVYDADLAADSQLANISTAILAGKNGGTGIGIVEIYSLK